MFPYEVALANLVMSAWSLVITLPDTLFEKTDSHVLRYCMPGCTRLVALDEMGNPLTTSIGLLYSTLNQQGP